MTIITKKRLIAAGVLSALIAGNMAMAADVPAGVQLAEKQTLVRNSGAEPQSLDPNKIEGVPEANISRDLFEGLLNTSPKDGHPIPGVAESWDNKDFKVWTFHLRKDAKWSNGEPVTAQDFVYSWQRLVDPKTASPYASYPQYGHIVNVDVSRLQTGHRKIWRKVDAAWQYRYQRRVYSERLGGQRADRDGA
ncbi:oligopeptide ABC transporter substrate-binding protein OppA [Klebsiella pneumoniae]|nr:oligopeptide ABC transporter substrate-binding protein OppA [Klebsiella pneumoniae]